jgi:Activator of Hsp90 ATPase homolog 1-like protein
MATADVIGGLSAASEAQEHTANEPVRKNVRVRSTPALAFEVFANEIDTWWPAMYHIGSSAPKKVVVEGREGGSIYTKQEDGTNSPWAKVLAWEPAHRFVFAWQVSPAFQYESDLEKNSEVEVSFAEVADGITEVKLEHRGFDRHGDGHEGVRAMVDAEDGWGALLSLFAAKAGGEG